MDPNNAQAEPMVIKTATPFYKSPPFLAGGGIFIFVALSFGLFNIFKNYLPQKTTPTQITQEQIEKPIKGLIGVVQAVDPKRSQITIKSEDKLNSYQVSNDVLISQLVLGIKSEEMKQFSMPSNILYLEDLAKQKNPQVYLVFDSNGKNVTQIQVYSYKKP